ncbi:hypothetical protein N0V87_008599 [Didymella glomerata]|jgi:hypothetical protein|uniref:Uncharacterized protein n=1 Tax=Didymella glomerata TaxID=749621 RepID=A0A9W9BVZ8_9PLEO|nr:hypothetical protein N0V87_008599 [Didymella glomerata]
MVQDPNFWRRFSVAVHNDEAAMLAAEAETGKRETKHAYVVSISSPLDSPSSVTTPTSQCHLSPAFPPAAFTRPVSAPAHVFHEKAEEKRRSKASGTRSVYFTSEDGKTPEVIALHKLPSYTHSHHPATNNSVPDLPTTPRSTHFALAADTPPSKRTSRFRFGLSSHPPSLPPTPKSTHFPSSASFSAPNSKRTSRFGRHGNSSRLSLGISLSGRPKSAFRFWTTITAGDMEDETNAGIRNDSWLEGQQRKARQRAWMCWAFWGVFLLLVVGAIVSVLVLRHKGII